jgi:hypothetical protein
VHPVFRGVYKFPVDASAMEFPADRIVGNTDIISPPGETSVLR